MSASSEDDDYHSAEEREPGAAAGISRGLEETKLTERGGSSSSKDPPTEAVAESREEREKTPESLTDEEIAVKQEIRL